MIINYWTHLIHDINYDRNHLSHLVLHKAKTIFSHLQMSLRESAQYKTCCSFAHLLIWNDTDQTRILRRTLNPHINIKIRGLIKKQTAEFGALCPESLNQQAGGKVWWFLCLTSREVKTLRLICTTDPLPSVCWSTGDLLKISSAGREEWLVFNWTRFQSLSFQVTVSITVLGLWIQPTACKKH